MYQYEYSGRAMVVCMIIDKEEEIRKNQLMCLEAKWISCQAYLVGGPLFDNLVLRKEGDLK